MSAAIAAELRDACLKVRAKSFPLADLIPLMQRAADYIDLVDGDLTTAYLAGVGRGKSTVTTRKIADALSTRDRTELATFSEYLRDRHLYKNDHMAGDAFAAKWAAYERGQSHRPTPQP